MLHIFVHKFNSSSFQLKLIAVESIPGCVFTLGKSYFPFPLYNSLQQHHHFPGFLINSWRLSGFNRVTFINQLPD